jgi:hypothetical protein
MLNDISSQHDESSLKEEPSSAEVVEPLKKEVTPIKVGSERLFIRPFSAASRGRVGEVTALQGHNRVNSAEVLVLDSARDDFLTNRLLLI